MHVHAEFLRNCFQIKEMKPKTLFLITSTSLALGLIVPSQDVIPGNLKIAARAIVVGLNVTSITTSIPPEVILDRNYQDGVHNGIAPKRLEPRNPPSKPRPENNLVRSSTKNEARRKQRDKRPQETYRFHDSDSVEDSDSFSADSSSFYSSGDEKPYDRRAANQLSPVDGLHHKFRPDPLPEYRPGPEKRPSYPAETRYRSKHPIDLSTRRRQSLEVEEPEYLLPARARVAEWFKRSEKAQKKEEQIANKFTGRRKQRSKYQESDTESIARESVDRSASDSEHTSSRDSTESRFSDENARRTGSRELLLIPPRRQNTYAGPYEPLHGLSERPPMSHKSRVGRYDLNSQYYPERDPNFERLSPLQDLRLMNIDTSGRHERRKSDTRHRTKPFHPNYGDFNVASRQGAGHRNQHELFMSYFRQPHFGQNEPIKLLENNNYWRVESEYPHADKLREPSIVALMKSLLHMGLIRETQLGGLYQTRRFSTSSGSLNRQYDYRVHTERSGSLIVVEYDSMAPNGYLGEMVTVAWNEFNRRYENERVTRLSTLPDGIVFASRARPLPTENFMRYLIDTSAREQNRGPGLDKTHTNLNFDMTKRVGADPLLDSLWVFDEVQAAGKFVEYMQPARAAFKISDIGLDILEEPLSRGETYLKLGLWVGLGQRRRDSDGIRPRREFYLVN